MLEQLKREVERPGITYPDYYLQVKRLLNLGAQRLRYKTRKQPLHFSKQQRCNPEGARVEAFWVCLQEFHAYEEGNLNWMAAFEVEPATEVHPPPLGLLTTMRGYNLT